MRLTWGSCCTVGMILTCSLLSQSAHAQIAANCIADMQAEATGYQNTASSIVSSAVPSIQAEFAAGDIRAGYAISADAQQDVVDGARRSARELSRIMSICVERLRRTNQADQIPALAAAFETARNDIGAAQASAISQLEVATLGQPTEAPPIAVQLAQEYTQFIQNRVGQFQTAMQSYCDMAVTAITERVADGDTNGANRLADAARGIVTRSTATNVGFVQRTGATGARLLGSYDNTDQLIASLQQTVAQAATDMQAAQTSCINAINAAIGGTPVNNPLPDSASTTEDIPVAISVLSNDPSGAQISAIAQQPSGGTAVIDSPTTTITYTPSAGFTGTDTFTYTIVGSTQAATVTVTVTPDTGGNPPVDDGPVSTAADTPVAIDVLANDPSGSQISAIAQQPSGGTAVIDSPTTTITYTPASGFTGQDTFTYTIAGSTQSATVTVDVGGGPADDFAMTAPDTPVDIDVLANDPAGNSQILSVTQPANGTVTEPFSPTGPLTYTPNQGFTGMDTFTYATNGPAPSATVTVTVGTQGPLVVQVLVNGQPSSAPGPTLAVGSNATFLYMVTNTGTVGYNPVVVRDDNGTPLDMTDDFNAQRNQGDPGGVTLDPGETFSFTATVQVQAGQQTHNVTVTGTPQNGPDVTATTQVNFVGGTAPSSLLGTVTLRNPTSRPIDVTISSVDLPSIEFIDPTTGASLGQTVQVASRPFINVARIEPFHVDIGPSGLQDIEVSFTVRDGTTTTNSPSGCRVRPGTLSGEPTLVVEYLTGSVNCQERPIN